MPKDKRYKTVKILIETGYITSFDEIFDNIPKTVVAEDFGTNYKRFSRLSKNVEQFKLKELYELARLFEIDGKVIIDMAHDQYMSRRGGNNK